MPWFPRALRTRLENIADTPGLEAFITELVRFAAKHGWAEVQPDDLAAFILHSRLSYRTRVVLKAYRVDRSALPPLRVSQNKVSSVLLSLGTKQIIANAVSLAARAGRAEERLRFSDVLIALCQSHITAPLMDEFGLTKLKVTYFLSHRAVLPEAIELALPSIDRRKPVWIRIQNDDFTPMDAVTGILSRVFQLDEAHARTVMLKVHSEGHAVLGPFEHDVACDLATRATEMVRNAPHPLLIVLTRSQNQSFFARHWRGELPLADSLKKVAIIGTADVVVLSELLLGYVFTKLPPGVARTAVYAWVFTAIAFMIWQWTGVWRAASRSTYRWKTVKVGPLVRVTMALLLLGAMSIFPSIVSRVHGLAASIELLANLPPLRIEVAARDALYVRGGIGRGAARELEQALNRHPDVRIVALDSPGGIATEGVRMQEIIRRRGLQTFVEASCFSACTLAFLGGTRRYLSIEGHLGFHRARSIFGSSASVSSQAERALSQSGVAQWFVERAQRTPPESMWIPTEKELLDAGVVTDVWD